MGREAVKNDLCAASKRLVDVMQQKCGKVRQSDSLRLNDSLESEQADAGLMRVDLSSDSGSMDGQEDAQEQGRPVGREDPPRPPLEDCEAYHERQILAPAQLLEPWRLEERKV